MRTLEEIQARKQELHAEIQKREEAIATTWESLWQPTKANTKGEMVTHYEWMKSWVCTLENASSVDRKSVV